MQDDENDMLDMAFGLTDTSRLGCQVYVSRAMDGMSVTLPSATRNMFVDGASRVCVRVCGAVRADGRDLQARSPRGIKRVGCEGRWVRRLVYDVHGTGAQRRACFLMTCESTTPLGFRRRCCG